ncbi:hypothetical protein POTOM_032074 [Populus tomentosa]|uniref:Uncharacterized protein n=1 Tax=Populus tomentosa TaxID=118781 RepID=A0A8X7ZDT2_POPTO|nr:hypothetical protein POTOM_032074 [Populus tomentosa]
MRSSIGEEKNTRIASGPGMRRESKRRIADRKIRQGKRLSDTRDRPTRTEEAEARGVSTEEFGAKTPKRFVPGKVHKRKLQYRGGLQRKEKETKLQNRAGVPVGSDVDLGISNDDIAHDGLEEASSDSKEDVILDFQSDMARMVGGINMSSSSNTKSGGKRKERDHYDVRGKKKKTAGIGVQLLSSIHEVMTELHSIPGVLIENEFQDFATEYLSLRRKREMWSDEKKPLLQFIVDVVFFVAVSYRELVRFEKETPFAVTVCMEKTYVAPTL